MRRLRWYLDNKGATSDTPEKEPNPQPKPTDPTKINEDVNLDLERLEALEDFLQQIVSVQYDYNVTLNSEIFYGSYLEKQGVIGERNKIKTGQYLDDPNFQLFRAIVAPTAEVAKLDTKNQKNLFDKIDASGLFELAAYADLIRSYGRRRFQNVNSVRRSAASANVLDGARDTAWLSALSKVLANLTRDPILLALLYRYFPDLTLFFLNSLALTADYSNDGKGGGSEDRLNDPQEIFNDLLTAFGQVNGQNVFEGAWDLINTGQRIEKALSEFPFRQNIPPAAPDIFHLRIGAANFYVPPINIDVQTQFKVSSMGEGALRQKNTPKFNAGYKHTTISMQLFFPNYEEIWGISIDEASKIRLKDNYTIDFSGAGDSDAKIDKFISSLRGLVAAFKYAPFLPVRNQYLNSVYGITAVALHGMTISTIPNYPFALVVNLQLYNFNHKPFLPMINDFNQAVHWGRFRQYMGKAAGALHNYINEEFLMVQADDGVTDPVAKALNKAWTSDRDGETNSTDQLLGYKNEVFTTNVIKEWTNGSNISFYIPQETQTKIFTPDLYGFRSPEEELLDDTSRSTWGNFLAKFGIDINESAGYGRPLDSVIATSVGNIVEYTVRQKVLDSIDILTAGLSAKDFQQKAYAFLIESFIKQNSSLDFNRKNFLRNFSDDSNAYVETFPPYKYGSIIFTDQNLLQIKLFFRSKALNINAYLDFLVDEQLQKRQRNVGKNWTDKDKEQERKIIKEQFANSYSALVYERFFRAGPIRELMEAARQRAGSFQLREWEVPMIRVDIDPSSAIVTDVAVSMSNNIVPLQVQMHEEPTYQHIGGGDNYVSISMKVFGEKELIKLRKIFDHINGLARLEHAAGVMGFMGIKNIITALSGIKYVLPLSFNVSTIPNYPHVYDVTLRLVDFDIFQQKREKLSSDQQRKLVEEFGTKKNPFLRIKQLWGAFNAYPDFPLELRNKGGEVVGCLDPDFYFRSFQMMDKDVVNSISVNKGKLANLDIETIDLNGKLNVVTPYGGVQYTNESVVNKFKEFINNNDLKGLKHYAKTTLNLSASRVASFIVTAIKNESNNSRERFLLDYVDTLDESDFPQTSIADASFRIISGELKLGDLRSKDPQALAQLESFLSGKDDKSEEDKYISFDPDELPAHAMIHTFASVENPNDSKIPSILQTADGYQFGYIDKLNGRFYLTIDDQAVKKDASINYIGVTDIQTPDRGTTKSLTGVPGATALSQYQYAFSSGDTSKPETMSNKQNAKSTSEHWEKMMVDTSYRDISGRMVRAFPTYMLWLISERTFAGTKLFDNFYGLQSIIDFSIVASEDILGDTLVFRVSNMYSKLSTKEMTAIFSGAMGETNSKPGVDQLSLTDGMEQIIDRTLNTARNMLGHMESQYIVDIENIRLKPGVRVHLRAGYGSNPNSLQTIFNGVITEVELGEIVTVTCQSDAIELSPIVNSVDKKGSSGKIDGGLNTGLYLSEPRDLMVRLLSMGSSRVRESFAYATRGMIFSENKFRHKTLWNDTLCSS